MTLYQKIMKLAKCGKMTVLQNKDKKYCIISTPDCAGYLRRSGWYETIEKCMEWIGEFCGLGKEIINSSDWTIVKTIDFASLGEGYEVGEKVRILPNAEEESRNNGIYWNEGHDNIIKKGYGFIEGKCGMDYYVREEYGVKRVFIRTCLEPFFEDEIKETIKIGDRTYDKNEVEKALENIKSFII